MINSSHSTLTKTAVECLSHLTPNERDGLFTLVERLYQRYGVDLLHVILFGSKARGDFTPESDLDILVVMRMRKDDYWRYWNEIVQITWDVELIYGLVTSLVIKSEHDYALMCEQQLLFARNIEQDGIELWTKLPNAPISKPT